MSVCGKQLKERFYHDVPRHGNTNLTWDQYRWLRSRNFPYMVAAMMITRALEEVLFGNLVIQQILGYIVGISPFPRPRGLGSQAS